MEADEEHSFTTAELFDLAVLYVRWVAVAALCAAESAGGSRGACSREDWDARRIGNHAGRRNFGNALAELAMTHCGNPAGTAARRSSSMARTRSLPTSSCNFMGAYALKESLCPQTADPFAPSCSRMCAPFVYSEDPCLLRPGLVHPMHLFPSPTSAAL